jgi:beta-galactosidase
MNKIIRLLLMAIIIFQGFSTGTKAQEKFQRKQLFDFNWKFFLGDAPTANTNNFVDKNWREINLPHDWSIEGKLDSENPMGNDGGYFPAGMGWYRKKFKVPESWKRKLVSIYFEGVYMNSEVFINGKSLGIHPYGYTSFSYDITSNLLYGMENVISVKVDNSKQKNCRWYSGSGIYRHVWMIITEPVHIAQWGVTITTPEVSPEKAIVQIKTKLENETGLPQSITLRTQVLGANKKNAGDNQLELNLPANSEKEIEQTIQVLKPLVWTPETPYLYLAHVQIEKSKKVIDNTRTTFGIRSIKFTTDHGFQLNGKTIKLNGGCVHHDNGCLGAAAYDRAEERRVELLQSAGFNALRTSHNPPSEALKPAD